MATQRIPEWSAQITYNGPSDERALLGRLAVQRGFRSTSAFLKRMILRGLEVECPISSVKLRAIRAHYYRPALSVALLLIFCGTILSHDALQRSNRRVRGHGSETVLRELR